MSSFLPVHSIPFRPRPWAAAALTLLGALSPLGAQTTVSSSVVELDELVVNASPLARSADALSQSVSLLSGLNLEMRRAPSLGQVLDGVPGVASTYFGPGASRPVIRGLGGERIRVLTNGLGTIDVSANSPDHAVSIEPALVERVEVLRGACTLLYGNAAVGGVVNVVDRQIPTEAPDRSLEGAIELRHGSAADEKTGSGHAQGAAGSLAWQVSLLRREAGDVNIPGRAESDAAHEGEEAGQEPEEQASGVLPNSAIATTSGSAGLSWFVDRGFGGFSYSALDTTYGVPGHAHAHEEEGEHEEHEDGEHAEAVTIALKQRRWDFRGEATEPFGIFRSARFRLGLADYEHEEREGEEVGTRFESSGWEGRLDLLHQPLGRLEGVLGLQVQRTELEAEGAEAYLPPTRTLNRAVFLLEEALVGRVRWQFGSRLEDQDVDRRDDTPAHRHKTAWSVSGGGIWTLSEGWDLAFSLARTERIPTAQELFAQGPHAATRSYEIGDPDLGKEKTLGMEIELRRRVGKVTGSIGFFASRVHRFIFEEPTAEVEDGFQVFRSRAADARFHGGELEAVWHVHEGRVHGLDVTLMADWVRAEKRHEGTALPRIPPVRTGLGVVYAGGAWTAGAEVRHLFRQDRVAPFETETEGATLVSAYLGYTFQWGPQTVELFARGSNLTDAEARLHTSYLKDLAPLPGRDLTLGMRLSF